MINLKYKTRDYPIHFCMHIDTLGKCVKYKNMNFHFIHVYHKKMYDNNIILRRVIEFYQHEEFV